MLNQHNSADLLWSSGNEVLFFNQETPDCGCVTLVSLDRLTDPAAGFLAGDRLRLKVEVVC